MTNKPRLRLERLIGRPGYAKLTIDHVSFTVSDADLQGLAEQLIRTLGNTAREQWSDDAPITYDGEVRWPK